MEYLHQHRITHRDLKPKNILLRKSGKDRRGFTAKVSDFGLSHILPDTNQDTQVWQRERRGGWEWRRGGRGGPVCPPRLLVLCLNAATYLF